MFLKKMYLKGFKSFAYPVEISFTDGLTVVVGPNGSGKSNINDALKWVLGEASKKNLRASNANDMIFAGSVDEKPAEYAEVTLYIDNSQKILNTKAKEVSITRKSFVNRSENEYYINGELAKRKDVKDLFMDTGLGNPDLSIISQGSISTIVGAKPKDLRNVLNEVAGVSRYQKQKEEAMRNLLNTERNLEIITVKLTEREKQLRPLKKQAEKAKEYFEIREKLEKIELPIIKKELDEDKKNLDAWTREREEINSVSNYSDQELKTITSKTNSNRKEILNIDKQIQNLQLKEKKLREQIEQRKLSSDSDIKNIELQIQEKSASIKNINQKVSEFEASEIESLKQINENKREFALSNDKIGQINARIYQVSESIEQLNKNSSDKLPFGVNNIVKNKDIFDGYVGLVKELYKVEQEFQTAIEIALKPAWSNVVMKNEQNIKDALKFLKQNNYGTATFIPYEQVKPKSLTSEFENILKDIKGYLGTVTENINFNKKYQRLFYHLGGITLIFEDYDTAIKAAKIIDFRFKIITLEGDVILPGFVIQGGSNKSKKDFMEDQKNKLKETFAKLNEELKELTKKRKTSEETLEKLQQDLHLKQINHSKINERLNYLNADLNNLLILYKNSTGQEYNSDGATKSEVKTFDSIETIQQEINLLRERKESLDKEVISLKDTEEELRIRWKDAINKEAELKEKIRVCQINLNKNINILQRDYKMNEDIFAEKEIEKLNISYNEAEKRRQKYRQQIEKIGFVNLESIAEFEELDKEFQKMSKELSEIQITKEKLTSTVEEMDNRMEEKFSDTFNKINDEFETAFIQLFNGGTARIKYSDPENILDSGIEIYARSPGKNVKNIQLYSGGEKSMIAIALIFAINKVRRLPLLMLDEVEAALDEANVERFALFAKEINKTTQVIITSHRPGTMEKADVLYGVTMQQKGITKILTVKLEDAIDMAD